MILLSALCALLLSGIVFAAVSNYLLQKKMDRLEDHYEAALRVKQSNEIASDVSVLGPGNGYTIGGAFSDDACESTNA